MIASARFCRFKNYFTVVLTFLIIVNNIIALKFSSQWRAHQVVVTLSSVAFSYWHKQLHTYTAIVPQSTDTQSLARDTP